LFEDSSIATTENDESIEIDEIEDSIRNSLTVSIVAYDQATIGNWVEVTSTEYENVKTNVQLVTTYGMTNAQTIQTGTTWAANCANILSLDSITTPANEFIIGFLARLSISGTPGTFTVLTGTTSGGTYNSFANSPNISGTDMKYFVRKAPTNANPSITYVGSVSNSARRSVGPFPLTRYDCSSPYSTWLNLTNLSAPVFQFIGTSVKQW
jgi:hypothetical protein